VRERGATCALVGSRGDAATTRAIRDAAPPECRGRVLDLAGATTLPVLAAVMSRAGVCVSNDSGAMHLAAATGVSRRRHLRPDEREGHVAPGASRRGHGGRPEPGLVPSLYAS